MWEDNIRRQKGGGGGGGGVRGSIVLLVNLDQQQYNLHLRGGHRHHSALVS